ncbi:MAG: VPLPA-CTERM sorting domain-containing protein [Halioglobus sp.]
MKSQLLVITTLFLALSSATQGATLVVDQQGFLPTTQRSGGVTGTGVQTFVPTQSNLAGVDIYLFSVAQFLFDGSGGIDFTADVTLNVYAASGPEDFQYDENGAIVSSALLLDTQGTQEGWAEFRWNPVAVTPATFYALEFTTDNGAFAASSDNPYGAGQRLEPGLGRDYFDLQFITYYDEGFAVVPVPAAAWLFGSAVLGLAALRRRGHSEAR